MALNLTFEGPACNTIVPGMCQMRYIRCSAEMCKKPILITIRKHSLNVIETLHAMKNCENSLIS